MWLFWLLHLDSVSGKMPCALYRIFPVLVAFCEHLNRCIAAELRHLYSWPLWSALFLEFKIQCTVFPPTCVSCLLGIHFAKKQNKHDYNYRKYKFRYWNTGEILSICTCILPLLVSIFHKWSAKMMVYLITLLQYFYNQLYTRGREVWPEQIPGRGWRGFKTISPFPTPLNCTWNAQHDIWYTPFN